MELDEPKIFFPFFSLLSTCSFYSTFSKISSNLHSLFSINDSALKIVNVKEHIFFSFFITSYYFTYRIFFFPIFKSYYLCLSVLVFSYRLEISTHDYVPRLQAEGLKTSLRALSILVRFCTKLFHQENC